MFVAASTECMSWRTRVANHLQSWTTCQRRMGPPHHARTQFQHWTVRKRANVTKRTWLQTRKRMKANRRFPVMSCWGPQKLCQKRRRKSARIKKVQPTLHVLSFKFHELSLLNLLNVCSVLWVTSLQNLLKLCFCGSP